MSKHYLGKATSFLSSLIYEYRCVAKWRDAKGFIVTLRINKLTGHRIVIDQKYVNDNLAAY